MHEMVQPNNVFLVGCPVECILTEIKSKYQNNPAPQRVYREFINSMSVAEKERILEQSYEVKVYQL